MLMVTFLKKTKGSGMLIVLINTYAQDPFWKKNKNESPFQITS